MAVPEIKLTPEDQRTLEALGADIAALEREVAKAERAGLGLMPDSPLKKLKEDLATAKKLREGVLKEYGR